MKIQECKRRVKSAIDKLNEMDHQLRFGMEEDESHLSLTAARKEDDAHRFGSYEVMVLFDDFKKKTTAYEYFMMGVERIVASTKLCDPKAYHNMI